MPTGKSFNEWAEETRRRWFSAPKPSQVLLAGKGPSFDRVDELDLGKYYVLGLKQVSCEIQCNMWIALDVEALEQCRRVNLDRDPYLLVPDVLHKDFRPRLSLEQAEKRAPVLAEFRERGRLVVFRNGNDYAERKPYQVVAKFFCAEAGLSAVAIAGARVVRTIGIDGGTGYSMRFSEKRKLMNGHASYSVQDRALGSIVRAYKLDYAPIFAHNRNRL